MSRAIADDVIFIGMVNGERKVTSMNRALDGIVNEVLFKDNKTGVSPYGLNMSKLCMPKLIKVKMADGSIIKVDFKTYCKKVAAQEVGYDSWPKLMSAMDNTWNVFLTNSSGDCILTSVVYKIWNSQYNDCVITIALNKR